MLGIYKAIIAGNKIRWIEQPPAEINDNSEIQVEVVIKSNPDENMSRGEAMYQSLRKLSACGGLLSNIDDPVAWQREIRTDRKIIQPE